MVELPPPCPPPLEPGGDFLSNFIASRTLILVHSLESVSDKDCQKGQIFSYM